MTQSDGSTQMVTALVQLRQALQDTTLPAGLPSATAERASRTEMVDQLEDYVIPRLMTLDAPLLAVVGGSTGAGKSTLVNSLAGRRSPSRECCAPLRARRCWSTTPTTPSGSAPTGCCTSWSGSTGPRPTRVRCSWCPSRACPPGWPSSTRPTSTRSRSRTAPSPPSCSPPPTCGCSSPPPPATPTRCRGNYLRQAADRSAAVAVVLDRTPPEAVDTVSSHLARMLASRGLKDSPLFTVTEGVVSDDGLLPAESVSEVKAWLDSLAADAEAREMVVRQTLEGAVRTLAPAYARGRRRRRRAGRRLAAAARERRHGVRRRDRSTSTRPPPTGPCCAARCSPAGRSWSAPASC